MADLTLLRTVLRTAGAFCGAALMVISLYSHDTVTAIVGSTTFVMSLLVRPTR